MTRLGVFGSRSLSDQRVSQLITDEIEEHDVDHLVTAGEPEGVCEVARALAGELGITLTLHHYPKHKGQGMYYWRSEYTLDASDRVILIHDGTSQGTANELEQTRARDIPHRYEVLGPPRLAAAAFLQSSRRDRKRRRSDRPLTTAPRPSKRGDRAKRRFDMPPAVPRSPRVGGV